MTQQDSGPVWGTDWEGKNESVTHLSSLATWTSCLKQSPRPLARLFCFPYAGGGASIFRSWVDAFPTDLEVCPIQLPGREDRLSSPPFTRLSLLVETVAEILLPRLDAPFAFFGHSMGALIAFELTRQLRAQQGLLPIHLFVSGHPAPHIPYAEVPAHQLSDLEFLSRLRQLNGIPEDILRNAEVMQVYLPLLRADFAMCETYVYAAQAPLDCPITAFGGLEDPQVSYVSLSAWRYQTNNSFALHMLPGNHFFPHSAQAPLIAAISGQLARLRHDQEEYSDDNH